MKQYTLGKTKAEPVQSDMSGNGFLAVLQRKELQSGTLTELSEKLSEAAVAAARTGKKATVSLQLVIEPKQGALHFASKITTKVPVDEENLCLFYVDDNGELTRDDPSQKEFDLVVHVGGKEEPEAIQEQAPAVNG